MTEDEVKEILGTPSETSSFSTISGSESYSSAHWTYTDIGTIKFENGKVSSIKK